MALISIFHINCTIYEPEYFFNLVTQHIYFIKISFIQ